MKPSDLSKRLYTLSQFVSPYQTLVDIGTDHCLVPIFLMKEGVIERAIAGDVNQGPINEAKANVHRHGLEEKIDVRLGDGLNVLSEDDALDVILIAGMGGSLIRDILEASKDILVRNKRLVLQPNNKAHYVRKWLISHGYQIIDEVLIRDQGIFYEAMVGERSGDVKPLSEEEIRFGPILLKDRSEDFNAYHLEQLNHLERVKEAIPTSHVNRQKIETEIKRIKAVLKRK